AAGTTADKVGGVAANGIAVATVADHGAGNDLDGGGGNGTGEACAEMYAVAHAATDARVGNAEVQTRAAGIRQPADAVATVAADHAARHHEFAAAGAGVVANGNAGTAIAAHLAAGEADGGAGATVKGTAHSAAHVARD